MERKNLILMTIGIFIVFLTLSSAYSFSFFGDDNENTNETTYAEWDIRGEIIDSDVTFTNISEIYKYKVTTNASSDEITETRIATNQTCWGFSGYVKLNLTNFTDPDSNISDETLEEIQSDMDNNKFNISIYTNDAEISPETANITYTASLEGNILYIEFEGNFTALDAGGQISNGNISYIDMITTDLRMYATH